MKVLMINSVCGVGSTGRICTDIADNLKVTNVKSFTAEARFPRNIGIYPSE